jgi:hypothetical protein
LHFPEIDAQFGFRARVETRLAHVAARNVDVGIEGEGFRGGAPGAIRRHAQGERDGDGD